MNIWLFDIQIGLILVVDTRRKIIRSCTLDASRIRLDLDFKIKFQQ